MKKRVISFILAALILTTALATAPVSAVDHLTSGNWQYTVNEDGETVTIMKYTGSQASVEIPLEIDSKTGTAIGDHAFMDNSRVGSVTVPDSVTKIGRFAFCQCYSLYTIDIPDSVSEIGEKAFFNCHSLF